MRAGVYIAREGVYVCVGMHVCVWCVEVSSLHAWLRACVGWLVFVYGDCRFCVCVCVFECVHVCGCVCVCVGVGVCVGMRVCKSVLVSASVHKCVRFMPYPTPRAHHSSFAITHASCEVGMGETRCATPKYSL